MYIPDMAQKIQNNFFVFQIIVIEFGVANSRYLEKDIYHRQSMC